MLRKLSVALATAVTAAVGLMGLAAPATAATNKHLDVKLAAVCKPDDRHAILAVVNKTDKWIKYVLKKKDGHSLPLDLTALTSGDNHSKIWGKVGPGQTAFEKVHVKSKHDKWLLFAWKVDHEPALGTLTQSLLGGPWHPVDKVTIGDLKPCWALATICKPDAKHVKLRVFNNSPWAVKFLLVRKDEHNDKHHELVKGEVAAMSFVDETVPFTSKQDKWLLFIKKKHGDSVDGLTPTDQVMTDGKDKFKFADKIVVGDVPPCKKPTEKPTQKPTKKPMLPVTGTSSMGVMGAGLGLLGIGALLLFVARRRRAME